MRITRASQPELVALVEDVAARAGFRPPERIWLTQAAEVEAHIRRLRRELHIGRGLVPALAPAELRSLIAHELAVLQSRPTRAVCRLNRVWTSSVTIADLPEATARSARIAADLRPLGEAVLASLADVQYDLLADATAAPKRRWYQNYRAISDLDDAWARWLARGVPVAFSGPAADELLDRAYGRPHQRLAAAVRGLHGLELGLPPPTPAVPVRPLTRREQHRLARRLRGIPGNGWVRWYTCVTAPAAWWAARARAEADDLRREVATVLGRPPMDTLEAVEVLINRNDELMAAVNARYGLEPETDDDEPDAADFYEPPAVLCGLVEDALFARGWRLEHPAIRDLLIGPAGERLDTARSVTRHGSEFDVSALRAVAQPEYSVSDPLR